MTLTSGADAGERERRVERWRGLGAFGAEVSVARDDDVAPPGQRPADRLPGLSAHHDRRAEGDLLEAAQVVRQADEQAAAMADAAVAGNDGDQADGRKRHGGDCRCGAPR